MGSISQGPENPPRQIRARGHAIQPAGLKSEPLPEAGLTDAESGSRRSEQHRRWELARTAFRDAQVRMARYETDPALAIDFPGSSPIRWGSGLEAAGGEEHAEAVVVAVAVAAGEAAVQLDDPVHGLSAAVR